MKIALQLLLGCDFLNLICDFKVFIEIISFKITSHFKVLHPFSRYRANYRKLKTYKKTHEMLTNLNNVKNRILKIKKKNKIK